MEKSRQQMDCSERFTVSRKKTTENVSAPMGAIVFYY